MSQRSITLGALGALTLSLLMAASHRGDAVRFQVAEGSSLSRSLTVGMTLNMDGGTMSFMGQEQEMPADDEPLELDMSIEVTDQFKKVDEKGVAVLARTFDTIAFENSGDDEGIEDLELEGETVYFTRGEGGEYVKTLGEDGEESDSLAGLRMDMDLTGLLPSGEVEAGAEWEAKSGKLWTVFLPGGLPYSDDEEALPSVLGNIALPLLAEGAEDFAINCTYVGQTEEEDLKLGEIKFEFEGSTSGDVAELIMAIAEAMGEGEEAGMPEDIAADAEIEFTGSGTLMWNLAGGHAHSFEMTLEPSVTVDMAMSQDMGDQVIDIEVSIEFSGDLTWNMTVGQ